MSGTPTQPTAVLAVKLWPELASPSGLVARVTSTTDVAKDDVDRTVVSTLDELQVAVGRWFDEFVRGLSSEG